MDLPTLDFLKEKNIYTGSNGEFRYKIVPDGENAKVYAYQTYCLEYCQAHELTLGEETFPLTPEGFQGMTDWLETAAQKLNIKGRKQNEM